MIANDNIKPPKHLAIIMDGNGRWAQAKGLPRLEGHRRGAGVVRLVTTAAREWGIRYLTLYSFSTENWKRPVGEIRGLMKLLREFCEKERDELMKNDIRLSLLGSLDRVPKPTRRAFQELAEVTANNKSMTLTLAIDYGSRQEIVEATRTIARDIEIGRLKSGQITEKLIATYLNTNQLPDPDLLIRTSGEYRLSNFLLWQLAYTEFYFSDVFWPDFDRGEFARALNVFGHRERRFGQTASGQSDASSEHTLQLLPSLVVR
ncbi:MAG: isoprenyl transferase [Myxococcota bacterium]|nr:isoprenyl transferase [Myxococcota bacterium]